MHYKKMLIAMAGSALLFGLGYGPAGEAAAENSSAPSAAQLSIKVEFKTIAQTSEASAKAKAEQKMKKFKNLIDLQQKALSETLKPGEIRYVYINDKEYQASSAGSSISGATYSIRYNTYNEYVEKYAAGNTSMPLQLQQAPEGYSFSMANIAPYMTQKEQDKIYQQVIAEGKASGQKIYVKKLQEKRTAVHLIYKMATEKNGITGVLGIVTEPAGPNDKTVESEPVMAQSEKLEVGGQEVIYTPIDNMEYKSVAWMNPQTRVNYIIRETRGHLTKEAMLALAGQIIEAST
ncbi:hypothetical protein GCM10010912_48460 [Paenibacillus albidus]|uniref:DUF4163 domain-containing protein n=1 Tax=Paenibacillus albidus TaxID=2041023 RepID=A0A917CUC8_9BACL|nr:hypothetical protein [Paenibacillus albidus]GGF98039.1 hypothetical protein GCM10010912_48460 [Paenibacillus albidus]